MKNGLRSHNNPTHQASSRRTAKDRILSCLAALSTRFSEKLCVYRHLATLVYYLRNQEERDEKPT